MTTPTDDDTITIPLKTIQQPEQIKHLLASILPHVVDGSIAPPTAQAIGNLCRNYLEAYKITREALKNAHFCVVSCAAQHNTAPPLVPPRLRGIGGVALLGHALNSHFFQMNVSKK